MLNVVDPDLQVGFRAASRNDLPALGRLGASLMREHHAFDPARFMAPREHPEQGYAWFLGTQLDEDDALVFVAERAGEVIGYVYATIEPRSWEQFREEAGVIHDLVVDERHRGTGIGTALLGKVAEWLRSRGIPRAVLWTATRNEAAQRLFAKLGFRHTMIEMTREL